MQKFAICTPWHNFVGLYLRNQGVYQQSGKKLVKQQYLLHMSSQCGELGLLVSEISWWIRGTPANLNGFRVLALLMQQRRSVAVNQTLHDVWRSPGLVHYIYIFGSSCPLAEFARCKIYFVSKSCILLYWQHYCMALEQWASAKLCGVQQRALFIFGRAAITLGIGPHSSYFFLLCYVTVVIILVRFL